ncbi:MAG: hypothetical protein Tsb002_05530 [Wenzhouxiangellaceae bacterium]
MSDFDVYEMKKIPNEKISDKIAIVQRDPRYIGHKVIPDGGGTSTLLVIMQKIAEDFLATADKVNVQEYASGSQ